MEWFIAVVVVAILGVAAMAAAGGMGEMGSSPVQDTYRQDLPPDRRLGADDLRGLHFGVVLRGYSMRQVDELLERLIREVSERDATIAELSAELPAGSPTGELELASPVAGAQPDPETDRPEPLLSQERP